MPDGEDGSDLAGYGSLAETRKHFELARGTAAMTEHSHLVAAVEAFIRAEYTAHLVANSGLPANDSVTRRRVEEHLARCREFPGLWRQTAAGLAAAYPLMRAQWEADLRSIVGNVPEQVFRTAAAAVDSIDPGAAQRNQSFRAAVEVGWIHGRASCGAEGCRRHD